LFPEGTTTNTTTVIEFQRGAFAVGKVGCYIAASRVAMCGLSS
jgi:hypothetical protein